MCDLPRGVARCARSEGWELVTDFLSEADARRLLQSKVEELGSLTAVAKAAGVRCQLVSETVLGHCRVGPRLAAYLGLTSERTFRYRPQVEEER